MPVKNDKNRKKGEVLDEARSGLVPSQSESAVPKAGKAILRKVLGSPASEPSEEPGVVLVMSKLSPEQKKAAQKAYDAGRIKQQSAKGNLWQKNHPEECAARMRRNRAVSALDGEYAADITHQRTPIDIDSDCCIVASDVHVPFHDLALLDLMFRVADEQGIKTLCVPGDFWDCDNFSMWTRTTVTQSFAQEKDNVRAVLLELKEHFDKIYFSRGNHEMRWINLNKGMMGMEDLFGLTRIHSGYKVTMDDHMHVFQEGQAWRLCHPRNYSQIPLSVARELAIKHQCNIAAGHSHVMAQGRDKSGTFTVADTGGLYHRESLDYLRDTTRHPMTNSGFYVLEHNKLTPYTKDAHAVFQPDTPN